MCNICAFKSIKKLPLKTSPINSAQYFSLALHLCHLLIKNPLTLEGAIQFFNGLEISGAVAVDILIKKNIFDLKDSMLKSTMNTRKFVNNKCYPTIKQLKQPLDAAFDEVESLKKKKDLKKTIKSVCVAIPIKTRYVECMIPIKTKTVCDVINL